MTLNLYVSASGDDLDQAIGRLKLEDRPDEVAKLAQAIDQGNEVWRSYALRHGGRVLEAEGSSVVVEVPPSALEELPRVRDQYSSAIGCPATVGVGTKLSESSKALMAGRLQGGDRVVFHTEECDRQLDEAEKKDQGEADRLAEVTLKSEKLGKAAPAMNPGAFAGASRPSAPTTQKPSAGQGEHSEADEARRAAEDAASPQLTHASKDFEREFHDHADAGEDQDRQQAEQASQQGDAKAKVAEALELLRRAAPILGQLKTAAPDAYVAILRLTQSVVHLTRAAGDAQMAKAEPAQLPGHKRKQVNCKCDAYTFVHRHGGGACKKHLAPMVKAEGEGADRESHLTRLVRYHLPSPQGPGDAYYGSQALWHLLGGRRSGYVPTSVKHEGANHWFLRHRQHGRVLDLAADQFQTPVPHHLGRGKGFLTGDRPDKRAGELLKKIHGLQKMAEERLEQLSKAQRGPWENVVFQQGDDAGEAMRILEDEGHSAALDHLVQWHQPGEHEVNSRPHGGNGAERFEHQGYRMVWDHNFPYIGLEYDTSYNPESDEAEADRRYTAHASWRQDAGYPTNIGHNVLAPSPPLQRQPLPPGERRSTPAGRTPRTPQHLQSAPAKAPAPLAEESEAVRTRNLEVDKSERPFAKAADDPDESAKPKPEIKVSDARGHLSTVEERRQKTPRRPDSSPNPERREGLNQHFVENDPREDVSVERRHPHPRREADDSDRQVEGYERVDHEQRRTSGTPGVRGGRGPWARERPIQLPGERRADPRSRSPRTPEHLRQPALDSRRVPPALSEEVPSQIEVDEGAGQVPAEEVLPTRLQTDPNVSIDDGSQEFDYSHHLPENFRQAGYIIRGQTHVRAGGVSTNANTHRVRLVPPEGGMNDTMDLFTGTSDQGFPVSGSYSKDTNYRGLSPSTEAVLKPALAQHVRLHGEGRLADLPEYRSRTQALETEDPAGAPNEVLRPNDQPLATSVQRAPNRYVGTKATESSAGLHGSSRLMADRKAFDYSHLLSPEQRRQGYAITIYESPNQNLPVLSELTKDGKRVAAQGSASTPQDAKKTVHSLQSQPELLNAITEHRQNRQKQVRSVSGHAVSQVPFLDTLEAAPEGSRTSLLEVDREKKAAKARAPKKVKLPGEPAPMPAGPTVLRNDGEYGTTDVDYSHHLPEKDRAKYQLIMRQHSGSMPHAVINRRADNQPIWSDERGVARSSVFNHRLRPSAIMAHREHTHMWEAAHQAKPGDVITPTQVQLGREMPRSEWGSVKLNEVNHYSRGRLETLGQVLPHSPSGSLAESRPYDPTNDRWKAYDYSHLVPEGRNNYKLYVVQDQHGDRSMHAMYVNPDGSSQGAFHGYHTYPGLAVHGREPSKAFNGAPMGGGFRPAAMKALHDHARHVQAQRDLADPYVPPQPVAKVKPQLPGEAPDDTQLRTRWLDLQPDVQPPEVPPHEDRPEPLDPKALEFFKRMSGSVKEDGQGGHVPDEEGAQSYAQSMAHAEREMKRKGWTVDWDPSQEQYDAGDMTNDDGTPYTPSHVEDAVLRDENGEVIGSLGQIADADGRYRRSVEAELAHEALVERGEHEPEKQRHYDYSHYLGPEERREGYKLSIQRSPEYAEDVLRLEDAQNRRIGSTRIIPQMKYAPGLANAHWPKTPRPVDEPIARAIANHQRAAEAGLLDPQQAEAKPAQLELAEPAPTLKKIRLPEAKPAKLKRLVLPVGTELNQKVKVQHSDGGVSWKSMRSGVIRSADPSGHPTSSRSPNSR